MFQTPNPEIDAAALAVAVGSSAQHAVRAQPIRAAEPLPEIVLDSVAPPPAPWQQGFLQRLRRVPVLGDTLAWGRHRLRAITAPGVPLRDRLRLLPLVGYGMVWGKSLVSLPRWRTQQRQEVAALREEIRRLERRQRRMMRVVTRLHRGPEGRRSTASVVTQMPRPGAGRPPAPPPQA